MAKEVKNFSDLGIKSETDNFIGEKIKLHKNLNTEMIFHKYLISPSKYPKHNNADVLKLQVELEGKKHVIFSISKGLMKTIRVIPEDSFPFKAKVINNNDHYEFV